MSYSPCAVTNYHASWCTHVLESIPKQNRKWLDRKPHLPSSSWMVTVADEGLTRTALSEELRTREKDSDPSRILSLVVAIRPQLDVLVAGMVSSMGEVT